MSDQQVGAFYQCERCSQVFDWDRTRHWPNGTARDGSRICPHCGTEFVRKFRESDRGRTLEGFVRPDVVRGTETGGR